MFHISILLLQVTCILHIHISTSAFGHSFINATHARVERLRIYYSDFLFSFGRATATKGLREVGFVYCNYNQENNRIIDYGGFQGDEAGWGGKGEINPRGWGGVEGKGRISMNE